MVLPLLLDRHAILYYCGVEHLAVSIYPYIKDGIENREVIYFSMESDLFARLLHHLRISGIPEESIKFRALKEMISAYREGGVQGLREKINRIINKVLAEGYNGIRWIEQPAYAVQEMSKQEFLNWEKDLTEAVKNTVLSLICIYDFDDYINKRMVINEKMMEQSLKTHSHILNGLVSAKGKTLRT